MTQPVQREGLIARQRNPYWMAPMSGISDVCFRQLMDEMGAGVIVSELVSAKGLIYSSGRTHQMIQVHPNPQAPIGIQLFGENADEMAEAGRMVTETGAAFVDVNLGCPVKKVVKKNCGAALMRNPLALEKYLTTIKKGIDLPLTVKMRTGWDHSEITIHDCVRAAVNSGCEWVAIHGRTRAQGYEGTADWDLIRAVKASAGLPIIGNGDIRSAEQARDRLAESGVDAVMIGRGALRNPWIFQECLGRNDAVRNPSPLQLTRRYLELLRTYLDSRRTLIMIRKFASWLATGYPNSARFRGRMYELHTPSEVLDCAGEFFDKVASLERPQFDESEAFMMGGHG